MPISHFVLESQETFVSIAPWRFIAQRRRTCLPHLEAFVLSECKIFVSSAAIALGGTTSETKGHPRQNNPLLVGICSPHLPCKA